MTSTHPETKEKVRPTTPPPHYPPLVMSTPISPKLHLLRPIEALVRYRETHGYAVLEEMIHIVRKASKAPSPNRCLIVLGGPDALALPMCECGIRFLCDSLGFHCGVDSTSSTAVGSSSTTHASGSNGQENGASGATMTQGGGAFLQLMRDYDQESADWKLFQSRGEAVLQELEWAANCNSSEVTIKLHSLVVVKQPFSAPIRVEVAVDWRDELGNEMAQIFTNTSGSAGAGPNGGSETTQNSGALGETTTYLDHQKGMVEQQTMAGSTVPSYSYPLMMVLSTKCDAPSCSVNISVFRKRMVSDKLKARCHYRYQNVRPARDKILLKDPDHEHLTVGSMIIEASTLSQIFAENEAIVQQEEEGRRSREKAQDKTSSGEDSAADKGTHVPYVDHVEKGPADEGVKYDADDYF